MKLFKIVFSGLLISIVFCGSHASAIDLYGFGSYWDQKDGDGIWAGYCGLGSFSGSSQNADPAAWVDDVVEGYTILDVEDCSVPTDNLSWGQVKELYTSE